MNKTFNDILRLKIENAISKSGVISQNIENNYLAGKHKEIVLSQLIKPVLPHQYDVGTGKVCDSYSFISGETDLIVYSKRLIQPLIFESNLGMFPIESVLSCIEVKSKLTNQEYKTSFQKFKNISDNALFTPGFHDENDKNIVTKVLKPTFELFSFDSNLANNSNYPTTEFNRYKNVDANWETEPIIRSICIANRGWWIFRRNKWDFHASENLNESISYLANLINTLYKIEVSRGNPRLGEYLTNIDGLKK